MIARTGLAALFLLPAVVLAAGGDEATQNPGRKIVVSASATVYVKPDMARLTFAITSEAPGKVRAAHDKEVQTVKDSLAALSFRNVDVQVVPLSLDSVIPGAGGPVAGAGFAGGGGGFGGGGWGGGRGGLPAAQARAGGVGGIEGKKVKSVFFVTVREADPDKLKKMASTLADAALEHGGAAEPSSEDRLFGRPIRRAGEPETVRGP